MRTQRGTIGFPVADVSGAPVLRDQGSDRPVGHGKAVCACDLPRRWSLRALLGGSVVGQVDDSPPVILEPDRALA
jgi:hypothetical protein